MSCRGPTRPSTIILTFLRSIAGIGIAPSRSLVPHHPLAAYTASSRASYDRAFSNYARRSHSLKEVPKPSSFKHSELLPPNVALAASPRPRGRSRRTPRPLPRERSDTVIPTPRTTPRPRAKPYSASKDSPSPSPKKAIPRKPQEPWGVQKSAIAEKLEDAPWYPKKRLSPDALEGIRALNAQYPLLYTTPKLAEQFKISPEAVRRILKSRWRPNDEEQMERRGRWERREGRIWDSMEEMGLRPNKEVARGRLGRRARGQDGKKNRKRNWRELEGEEDEGGEWEEMRESRVEGLDTAFVTREEPEEADRAVSDEEDHEVAFNPVRLSLAI